MEEAQETTSAFDVTNSVSKTGDNMHGNLHMNGNRVTGLPTSLKTSSSDAISWGQADLLIGHGIRGHVENHLESFALKNYVGYVPPLSANSGRHSGFTLQQAGVWVDMDWSVVTVQLGRVEFEGQTDCI